MGLASIAEKFRSAGAWRFIWSSGKFIVKSGRRALAAMVLVLLQSTNLYSSNLRLHLPEAWLPIADAFMAVLNESSFWLAIAIGMGAVLYTYYEVDREIRNPATTKTLKKFYVDMGAFLNRKVTTDPELQLLTKEVDAKESEVYGWVKANMEPSSLARLTQQGPTGLQNFGFKRDDACSAAHSLLMDRIIRRQERLLTLIEQPVWT